MKKKNIFTIIVISLVLTVLIGISVFHMHAATCTPANGTACIGECCKLTTQGLCIAGPCSVILK